MKKGAVTFIIIIIFIAALLGGIYYFFERPNSFKNYGSSNISIGAFFENKHVKTGYNIYSNGIKIGSGETLDKGYILESVPVNKSVKIKTYNLENQNYYITTIEFLLNSTNAYRANLNMIKPGELLINHEIINKTIFLEISSEGLFKNPIYCIEWSDDILYLNSNDRQINRFDNYSKYDKCFIMENDISEEIQGINLTYVEWKELKSDNFINILFIDSENEIPLSSKKEIQININNI